MWIKLLKACFSYHNSRAVLLFMSLWWCLTLWLTVCFPVSSTSTQSVSDYNGHSTPPPPTPTTTLGKKLISLKICCQNNIITLTIKVECMLELWFFFKKIIPLLLFNRCVKILRFNIFKTFNLRKVIIFLIYLNMHWNRLLIPYHMIVKSMPNLIYKMIQWTIISMSDVQITMAAVRQRLR